MRTLTHFTDQNETMTLSLQFAEAQNMFIVFRQKATGRAVARVTPNGSVPAEIAVLNRTWRVTFDSAWGGPASAAIFATLTDWANRLIGDEQEPDDCEWIPGHEEKDAGSLKALPAWFINNQPRPSKGRYCFTTRKYFTKDSPLIPSGLIGPMRLIQAE